MSQVISTWTVKSSRTGNQVAEEGRKAEGGRLPVERQGRAEGAVGVPQWKDAVVDLGPRQGRPGDDLSDEIEDLGVVRERLALLGEIQVGRVDRRVQGTSRVKVRGPSPLRQR